MNRWIIIGITLFLILVLLCNRNKIFENFTMYEDDSRIVRYGDVITIWSPIVNKFFEANNTLGNKMTKEPMGKLVLSQSLMNPEDISSSMMATQFLIVDANDNGDIGNTSAVKYGAPIYLKSIFVSDNNLPTYIAPSKDNNIYLSTQRFDGDADRAQQQLIIESAKGLQDTEIKYGDMINIKTWKNNYIHISKTNDIVIMDNNTTSRNFYVYDRFGQGSNVDWARRGSTRQSTTNNNLYSNFAIDGNILTFSSTTKEQSPWWEVILPKDILISDIYITNTNDSSQMPLSNFDIILYDFDNALVDRKKYSDKVLNKYSWNNINQISRRVKILMNKQGNLNLAEVKVYGQAVNYSILLNEEMSKNLINTRNFKSSDSLSFRHRELPIVHKDMTMMFLIEFSKLPSKVSNIFVKSKNISENRTPNLLIHPPKVNANYSTLQYIVSTDINNNELGENFMINYNVIPNKKFHLTAVHNAGINKNNGWAPCKFSDKSKYSNSIYLCNFTTREFYKIIMEDSAIFKGEPIIDLDDPDNYGFSFRGLYKDSMSIPKILIYINGVLNTTYQLKGNIIQNINSLNIGSFGDYSGFDGTISFLKYSNRVIPNSYIQKESQILTGKMSIELLTNSTRFSTQNIIKIDPNYLPEINSSEPQYSLYFWLNSQRPIVGTGNNEPIFEYGREGLFFKSDSNSLFTKSNSGVIGLDNVNYKVPVDQWIFITYTVSSKNISLYVNNKLVASKTPSKKDVKLNNFHLIKVGGFNGFISNLGFSNYSLTEKDIKLLMNNHPNQESFEKIKRVFNKSGCTNNPIDTFDPYVDNYNVSWINFANKNEDAKLDQSIVDFKKLADEGINTEDPIKLKLAEKCYGVNDSQNRVLLSRNKRLLKEAEDKDKIKCLPKAPFTCKTYNINDFDIKTHKDFNKFVEKSKIRAPPKPIEKIIELPPDPNKYYTKEYVDKNFVDKKEFEKTPTYLEMKTKLEAMTEQVKELDKMKELVKRCQENEGKLATMEQSIENLKKLSGQEPANKCIQQQITKLDKEMRSTEKVADKDLEKLKNTLESKDTKRMTLEDIINSKLMIDDELKDLITSKDNYELLNLQKKKCSIDKTGRTTPFSSSNVLGKKINGNGYNSKWLKQQILDLDKIEEIVKNDLKEIENRLNKMNEKVSSSNVLSIGESAEIKNDISSLLNKSIAKQ